MLRRPSGRKPDCSAGTSYVLFCYSLTISISLENRRIGCMTWCIKIHVFASLKQAYVYVVSKLEFYRSYNLDRRCHRSYNFHKVRYRSYNFNNIFIEVSTSIKSAIEVLLSIKIFIEVNTSIKYIIDIFFNHKNSYRT